MSKLHRAATACLATVAVTASTLVGAPAPTADAFDPATKWEVINYLNAITGDSIVSGQHNKEPATLPSQYTAQVHDVTGQYPGLWGGELMFAADDVANRQIVIDQAKTEWANGSLVTLMWHVCPPTMGSSCSFEGGVNSDLSDAQFSELITTGTALNNAWKQRLDEVVPYLQQLEDAGVPVLFRPLHEMNETWNWWGGRPGPSGSARLFQITRDHLTGYHGLDNLIWVWNVQDNPAGGWADYYPGDSYVDVVSLDVWYKSLPSWSDYDQIRSIAGAKPIAIGETGKVPSDDLLWSQTEWSYFMVWSEHLRGNNTNEEIQSAYFHPRTLNQGEVELSSIAAHPARLSAWPTSALTLPHPAPRTARRFSSTPVRPAWRRPGRPAATAPFGRWTSAWTWRAQGPQTAPTFSSGTATAPSRRNGRTTRLRERCATPIRTNALTSPETTQPTLPGCRFGTVTGTPINSGFCPRDAP